MAVQVNPKVSWQFTRNCRRDVTDSEASVPKPVCSFLGCGFRGFRV